MEIIFAMAGLFLFFFLLLFSLAACKAAASSYNEAKREQAAREYFKPKSNYSAATKKVYGLWLMASGIWTKNRKRL